MIEFTNHNGILVHPEIYTYDYQGNTVDHVLPTHPDFPAAVEALKALVPEPHSCETCVYEAYNDRERWPCRDCSVLPDREDCWRERGHADE